MKANNSNSRLVYSTGLGSVCPDCEKPKNSCICNEMKRKVILQEAGIVRISYDTAGRKGKGMTLISGLALSQDALLDLAKQLKQQLGTGGAVKDFVIELQGDQREKVREILRKLSLN